MLQLLVLPICVLAGLSRSSGPETAAAKAQALLISHLLKNSIQIRSATPANHWSFGAATLLHKSVLSLSGNIYGDSASAKLLPESVRSALGQVDQALSAASKSTDTIVSGTAPEPGKYGDVLSSASSFIDELLVAETVDVPIVIKNGAVTVSDQFFVWFVPAKFADNPNVVKTRSSKHATLTVNLVKNVTYRFFVGADKAEGLPQDVKIDGSEVDLPVPSSSGK